MQPFIVTVTLFRTLAAVASVHLHTHLLPEKCNFHSLNLYIQCYIVALVVEVYLFFATYVICRIDFSDEKSAEVLAKRLHPCRQQLKFSCYKE